VFNAQCRSVAGQEFCRFRVLVRNSYFFESLRLTSELLPIESYLENLFHTCGSRLNKQTLTKANRREPPNSFLSSWDSGTALNNTP